MDAFGNLKRYKACLVAHKFSQVPDIDYIETYSLVVKLTTVCLLIALAAQHELELHQINVKIAFLHGNPTERIYMTIPPGLLTPQEDAKLQAKHKHQLALLLFQVLYRLEQSTHLWYHKFDAFLRILGFIWSGVDCNLYSFYFGRHFVLLALYVDDCLLDNYLPLL